MQNLSSDYLSIRVVPSAATDAPCKHLRLVFASKELNGFSPQLVVVPKISTPILEPPEKPTEHDASQSGIFSQVVVGFDDWDVETNSPGGQFVLTPTDDAFISPLGKKLRLGGEHVLVVDSIPGNLALLKFDLSSFESRRISSAVLRLYSKEKSPNGGTFHVLTNDADSDWDEGTVSWNNAPRSDNSPPVGQLTRVKAETWVDLDITSALDDYVGDFITVLIESTGKNRVVYSSKEGGPEHAPQLVLNYEESISRTRNGPITCASPAEGSLDFLPTGDAPIREAEADENFYPHSTLRARYENGSRVDSLLKFEFNCIYTDSIVSRAVLKLYCKNGSPNGGQVVSVQGDWTEETVTWNSAPKVPTGFSESIGMAKKDRWVEIDVTSAITQMSGYEVTFRIVGLHENAAFYSSRQDVDSQRPTLELFFEAEE